MATKWIILRYDPPHLVDQLPEMWKGMPRPADDIRLQWNDDYSIVTTELWYGLSSLNDHTTFDQLLEQFHASD